MRSDMSGNDRGAGGGIACMYAPWEGGSSFMNEEKVCRELRKMASVVQDVEMKDSLSVELRSPRPAKAPCHIQNVVLNNPMEELIQHILSFLPASDLAQCMGVCRWLRAESSRGSIWLDFCKRRWNLSKALIPKVYGANTWHKVYLLQAQRQRMPRGIYSHKHNIVWAKGRNYGVDVWVTMAHRSDSRPVTIPPEHPPANAISEARGETRAGARFGAGAGAGADGKYIELRLVVQNVRETRVLLDLQRVTIVTKCGLSYTTVATGVNHPRRTHPRLLAFNGQKVLPEASPCGKGDIWALDPILSPFDFAVFSVHVPAPDCQFETDFLERTACLVFPYTALKAKGYHDHYFPQSCRQKNVQAKFLDEKAIWSYYSVFSSGFVVLKDKEPARDSFI